MSDQPIVRDELPEPFESYTGNDPYIFVSYARLDKSFVYNTLQIFHDAKVNVGTMRDTSLDRVGGGDCSGYQEIISFRAFHVHKPFPRDLLETR